MSSVAVPSASSTTEVAIASPSARADNGRGTRLRPRTDAVIASVFLLGALVVTGGLWIAPNGRAVAHNVGDQVFFEWLLSYTAHALTHATNPFFTPLLNAPLGVNIASNTAVTIICVVLAPVTMLFGPSVAFVTAVTLNLSLSAYAWYWLFSRHVTRYRSVAMLGGALCGFAPGMISHANAHLNFTAQFVIPLLIWRLTRLVEPGRAIGNGTIVGVLTAVQYSLGAELLFFLAIATAVFLIAWAIQRPRAARFLAPRVARGLGAGSLVAGVLLAYPIWMQFAGPQAYHGTGFGQSGASEDLLAYGAYPWQSMAGTLGLWWKLAVNFGEENSFFGPGLLIVTIYVLIRLSRRRPTSRFGSGTSPSVLGRVEARALGWTAIVIAVLAIGPRLRVGHWRSPIPMPWAVLGKLPFFDAALPGRFALLLAPIVALVVVVTIDEVRRPGWRWAGPGTRRTALAVGVIALVPLVPVSLPTAVRGPIPVFFSSGDWRAYLTPGTSVVAVPPPTDKMPDGQRWQTATNFAFPITGGYFLGRGPTGKSYVGAVPRPTSALFATVAENGAALTVTDGDRQRAEVDLAFWRAGLVVLPDATTGVGDEWSAHHDELLRVCRDLLGAGRHVDDVWLWRVSTPVRLPM